MNTQHFKNTKRQKPSLRDIYIVSFALYTNLAIDTLRFFLGQDKPLIFLENLTKSTSPYDVKKYASILKANYPFVRQIIRPDASDADIIQTALLWGKQMAEIRNMYSHARHRPGLFNKALCEDLLRLYTLSIENGRLVKDGYFPDKYRPESRTEGGKTLFGVYGIYEDNSCFLTYTGIVFFTSLFLKTPDVNEFISAMCGNAIDRDESLRLRRDKHKDRYGKGVEYPKELQVKQKDFLYAPDVYTRFAVKGHTTAVSTHLFDKKIRFFELMEYLKQCPAERVNCLKKDDNAEKDLSVEGKTVKFPNDDAEYLLREKNRFTTLSLDYWHDFMARYIPRELSWEWARHASAEQKQQNKEYKGFDKLGFHERIIWEVPADSDRYNEFGDKMTFPYFTEGNNVFFRLHRNNDTRYYIGKMSATALCELIGLYFAANDKHRFMGRAFNETYAYQQKYLQCTDEFRKRNTNWATPVKLTGAELSEIVAGANFNPALNMETKIDDMFGFMIQPAFDDDALKAKIQGRIEYLASYYGKLKKEAAGHQKVTETVKAWTAVLNYGAAANWAHSIDMGGAPGVITQYRMITYYLSRLTENNPNINRELNAFLVASGVEKLLREHNRHHLLTGDGTLDGYFDKAMEYRLSVLKDFRIKTEQFNKDDWAPDKELRWLKMSTPQTAAAYPKKGTVPMEKKAANTGIKPVNAEQGVYFANKAVPLPRQFHAAVIPATGDANNHTARVALFEHFYKIEDIKLYKSNHIKQLQKAEKQDRTLAGMIADYAGLTGIAPDAEIKLSNHRYESHLFTVKYTVNSAGKPAEVYVAYYYRYLKSARYRYSVALVQSILKAMLKHQLIQHGDTVPFCRMTTQTDGKGDVRFVKDESMAITLLDSIAGYQKQRGKFIDQLMKLDYKAGNMYRELYGDTSDFLKFSILCTFLSDEKGVRQTDLIKEYRNAALHGQVYVDGVTREENKLLFFETGIMEVKNALDVLKAKKQIVRYR